MNPANFESYIDPNGGEWIRLKRGDVKNVVFRPADIHFTEEGNFGFNVELFEGPGITPVTEENQEEFYTQVQSIMTEMLAYEQAALEQLGKEDFEQKSSFHEEIGILQGENAHEISEALLPQDLQLELDSIATALGGLKKA